MQDTIERSIVISAPLERVWDLVTDPGWWVPADAPVVAGRTPGTVVVRESEKHGRVPVQVVELRPMTYASFRWATAFPGEGLEPEHTTLIEFTVTPGDDGVIVTVVESGFTALPTTDQVKTENYESHSGGWTAELASLRDRSQA